MSYLQLSMELQYDDKVLSMQSWLADEVPATRTAPLLACNSEFYYSAMLTAIDNTTR